MQEQIACTLLARRLVFSFGAARQIECNVAGGRLLRYAEAGLSGTTGSTGDFCDVTETDVVDSLLRDFAHLVGRSLEGETLVSLETRSLSEERKPGGVSADQVAEALGLSAELLPATEFHTRFVDEARASIRVAAYLDGDLLFPLCGDEDDVEHLAELLSTLLPDIDRLACRLGDPENLMINLGYRDAESAGVSFVLHDKTVLIASVVPNGQAALARAWYALQRGA